MAVNASSHAARAVIVFASLVSNAACSSHECNELYAPSGASVSRQVTASFDASKPLHVELCYNDECNSSDFSVGGDSSAARRLCVTDRELLVEPGCSFRKLDDGSWSFAASWEVNARSARNGDRYRANLSTSDAAVLVSVDATATYTESEPNGEGCGTNKRATL